MADDVVLNPGSGGDTIAADDIGGAKYQRVKLVLGADGANDGDVSGANPVPVSAAALTTLAGVVKAEDSASADGDPGVVMLAQRRDIDATAVSNDGDYGTLKIDEEGRLKVASKPASYAAITGNITANGQTVFAECTRFSNLMVHCTGTFSTVNVAFEGSLNSTNGTDGTWFGLQAIRSNANTIETTTGNLSAAPAYAWELSVNALKYFRVRATAFTSGTQTWTMIPGTYATEPIPGAQISGTQPVSFTQPALVAGTALVGDVSLGIRTTATNATLTRHLVSAASTNLTSVKASAGRVFGWYFANTNAAWRYVKLHNTASAPTAGTGIIQTIAIPPNGVASFFNAIGFSYATGIGLSTVTDAADNGTTAVGANDIVGELVYA